LKSLQQKFPDQVVLLGVLAEGQNTQQSSEREIDFPILTDSESRLAATFDVSSVPCVLLVDQNGTVLYSGHPAAIDEPRLTKLLGK
jgi:cytochrome c biogenesis protein CcmG, thiol:disulfide interchange protein DsbE